jgi:hypothetical protein
MEESCQLQVPVALPPEKEPPVPIGQEVGWVLRASLEAVGREKSLAPAVQPIARRYTDWAISGPNLSVNWTTLFQVVGDNGRD